MAIGLYGYKFSDNESIAIPLTDQQTIKQKYAGKK